MLHRIWIELRSIPEKFIYLVFKLYILKWSVHICSKNIFISWWGYCFSFSFIMFTNIIICLFYLLHWCENVIIIKLYGKYFFSLQEVTSFWNCWKGQILNNWKQIKFWHFLSWIKIGRCMLVKCITAICGWIKNTQSLLTKTKQTKRCKYSQCKQKCKL